MNLEKNIQTMILDESDFIDLTNTFKENGFDRQEFNDCEAFVIKIEDITYVIFNKDKIKDMDEDMISILAAHECAHAIEDIKNEEEADMWALQFLNKNQQNILKEMWRERHGYDFKS